MQHARPRPTHANAVHENGDLFVGEHAAGAFRESRHRGAGNSIRGGLLQHRIVGDREIDRIGESDGGSAFPVRAMAARAVLFVQRVEI